MKRENMKRKINLSNGRKVLGGLFLGGALLGGSQSLESYLKAGEFLSGTSPETVEYRENVNEKVRRYNEFVKARCYPVEQDIFGRKGRSYVPEGARNTLALLKEEIEEAKWPYTKEACKFVGFGLVSLISLIGAGCVLKVPKSIKEHLRGQEWYEKFEKWRLAEDYQPEKRV